MSKYSDFKGWMATNTAKTEEEKVVLLEASVGDGSGTEMQVELESGKEREDDLMVACLCITYADHVTTKMQAEIDALKASKSALLDQLKIARSWIADGENSDSSGIYPDFATDHYLSVVGIIDETITSQETEK